MCGKKNHFQSTGRLSSATMSQVCPFRLALSRPGNIYMSNAAPFRGNSLQKYHIFYIEYLVRQREHWWGLQSSLNAQLLSAQYYCICRILGVCSYPHPHLALLANRLLNGGRKKEDKTSGEQLEDQWNLYSQIMEIFCVQETNSVVHLPLCSRTGSSSGSFQSSFKKSFVYRPKRHTQSTSN